MANLLDSASILLSPTAYDNGSMLAVKPENGDGDFTFSRNSSATRVNAQGLVENVQILSSDLVSNGNFSQEGVQEVSNGSFSQEGAEEVTNGDFSNGQISWTVSGENATHIATFNGDTLRYQSDTTSPQLIVAQGNVLVVGKIYKITIDVKTLTSGSLKSDSLGGLNITPSVGINTFYATATGTTFNITRATTNVDIIIDNVSVKEVGQDWSLGGEVTIGDNLAHFESNTNTYSYIRQDISSLTSKTYKIQLEVKNYVSGAVQVAFSGASPITQNLNISTDGVYTAYLTPNANGDDFEVSREFNGGNFNFDITNISVKEVGQDWTLGSGWSIGDGKAVSDGLSNYENIYQTVSPNLVVGNKYLVSFGLTVTSGALRIRTDVGTYYPNVFNTSGNQSIELTLTSGSDFWFNSYSGFNGSITNISVIEITDDTNLPRINYEGFSYQDSLGSEEVVNGDFATDTNWIKNGQVTIGGGVAYFDSDGTFTQIAQSISGVSGKNVKVVIEITEYTQGTLKVLFSGGTQQNLPNSIGVHTLYFNNADSDTINIARLGGVTNLKIDHVSVKEVLGQEVVPNSGCGSWLLEPQSTNLVTYSEDFSNASWTKSGSSVVSGFTSPDGGLNAFKLVEGTNIGNHQVYKSAITNSGDFSNSIFVKASERSNVRINSGTNTFRVDFDLSNGTVISEVGATGNIVSMSNGWYKCDISWNTVTVSAQYLLISTLDDSGTQSYQGDGTSGIYIFGAQLEQKSYSTSYIPTTQGAISTRLADIATNSGNASLINSEEGVLYAEISALSDDLTNRFIALTDTTANNSVSLFYGGGSSNFIRCEIKSNSITQSELTTTAYQIDNYNKIAIKYKENDFALWVNGIRVSVDLSGNTPIGLSNLSFNRADALSFYGKNKALAVYKTALTDANLRSLTYPPAVATTFDLNFNTIADDFTFTRGSEATFVNAQGLIQSTASNDAPRLDYSTGAEAFLLEPQSTNLQTYSSNLASVYVPTNITQTSNYGISPDGSSTSTRLVLGNLTDSRSVETFTGVVISGNTYTFSAYYKGVSGETTYMYFLSSTGGTSISKQITFNGNWQRESITFTAGSASNYTYIVDVRQGSSTATDFEVWGAQVEQQSYATSYIPTSGASATRNQELCNNATPVINSEEGTLYAEISALADDGTYRILALSNGTSAQRIYMQYTNASNSISVVVKNGSVTQANIGYTLSDETEFSKIGFKYKLNDFALWVNGVKVATDTSGLTPIGLSELSFDNGSGGNNFYGNTKGLKYYPKALADVQLQDLTTI